MDEVASGNVEVIGDSTTSGNTKKRKSGGRGRPKSLTQSATAIENTSTNEIPEKHNDKRQKINAESTPVQNSATLSNTHASKANPSGHGNVKSKLLNKFQENENYEDDMTSILQAQAPSRRSQHVEQDANMKRQDESCFVCHEKGNVIICDFPDCPKVYHQVCLFTSLPLSASMDGDRDLYDMDGDSWYCPRHFCIQCCAIDSSASAILSPTIISTAPMTTSSEGQTSPETEDSDTSQNVSDNEAQAIVNTSSKPHVFTSYRLLPRYLHSVVDQLQSRQLRSCISCPFSVCIGCEQDIATSVAVAAGGTAFVVTNNRYCVFRCRRGNNSSGKVRLK